MKNPLGIILTLVGLALVIYGITVFGDSGESASVLGLDVSVQDNDMRTQSYLFMGAGVLALIAGIVTMRKK